MDDPTTPTARRAGPLPAGLPVPLAALALAAVVGACATTGGMLETRGEGVTRFYEASFDTLWAAARHAVRANGLRTDEESERERYIVATNPPDRDPGFEEERVAVEADQGERIAVFVDSVAPRTWSVEVVTRRRFSLDPGKTPWAKDIFWVIERDLEEGARVRRQALPDSLRDAPSPGAAADTAAPRR